MFLTKEDISVSGMFLTGFSANYIRGVINAPGLSPSAYVAAFIQAAEQEYEVVRRPWFDKYETDLRGAGIRTRRGSGIDAYVVQYYLIADERAGTVTLLSFEAPESEWDEAWKHGKLMLSAVGWR